MKIKAVEIGGGNGKETDSVRLQ